MTDQELQPFIGKRVALTLQGDEVLVGVLRSTEARVLGAGNYAIEIPPQGEPPHSPAYRGVRYAEFVTGIRELHECCIHVYDIASPCARTTDLNRSRREPSRAQRAYSRSVREPATRFLRLARRTKSEAAEDGTPRSVCSPIGQRVGAPPRGQRA